MREKRDSSYSPGRFRTLSHPSSRRGWIAKSECLSKPFVAPSATSRSVEYGQVDFAALEQLENLDLHVDSVWIMNLFRKIKEVLPALECPKKFSLKDPIKPEADRTDSFLSASQFCIYRHEK